MEKLRSIATALRSQENIDEGKILMKIAAPLILSQLLFIFGFQQGVLFCGHLGKEELDAAGLGFTLIHVFGSAVAMGLTSASDTLMAQHFGSANKKQVGVVLQRSIWISGITSIICSGFLLNVQWILKITGQSPTVSVLTTKYVKTFIIGLPAFFLNMQLQKILQCQSIIWPILVMFIVLNVGIAALHGLFLYVFHWGVVGSALAISLGYWIADLSLIGFIIWRRLHVEIWGGWTKASLLDWSSYVKLGLPGLGMICLEWSSFETATFLSGQLGEQALGGQVVAYQVAGLMFMFPFGLATASSIRVGNSLGERNHTAARRVFILSSIMTTITALCVGGVFAAAHSVIPYIFTSSPEIVKVASAILPQLLPFHFFDAVQGNLGGVVRGCGRQLTGAFVAFIGYIVLGLPIALPLMLKSSLKLHGMWLGMNVGGIFQTVFYLIFFWRLNWEGEAQAAAERIEHEHQVEESVHTSESVENPSFGFSRLQEEPCNSESAEKSSAEAVAGEIAESRNSSREKQETSTCNGQDNNANKSITPEVKVVTASLSVRWFLIYRLPVIGGSLLFLLLAICLSVFVAPDFQSDTGNGTAT